MKFKIGLMVLVLIAAMAAPYFMKGKNGEPLMSFGIDENMDILSTEQTRQQYAKWQDENGVWHFGDDIPEGVHTEVVNVDTAANVIRSVKLAKKEAANDSKKPGQPSAPSLPLPMTVDPGKVSEIMDDATNVQNLLDERAAQLEKVR
jgi:hypothetical protein